MQVLGIDIGGTGIKGAVVETETGEIVRERIRVDTPHPATPEAITSEFCRLVREGFRWEGPVACGFPARVLHGVVQTASNIDPSWVETPVEEMFSKALGRKVHVANDADVAGLAELRLGAARGVRGPVLFLTIGTGIGSAIFLDGRLYPNTELGHLRFHGDIAERYCSAAVRERLELKWGKWGERLNDYLAYLEFLLAPELIILGGGASKRFEKYQERLTIHTPVVPAKTLNLAGIIGAALYGAEQH
ncbi:MAG: ROK family protein [Succinivibrionaceae bacterium]|nr:ROK family protein [Succinivibrionaceae bacterium]